MGEVWVSPTLVSLGSSCFYRVSLCSSGWPHVYQSSFLGLPGAGVKGMCLCAGPHPLTVVRGPKGGTPQDYLGYALVSLDQHLVTGSFLLPCFQSRSFSGECGLCPRARGRADHGPAVKHWLGQLGKGRPHRWGAEVDCQLSGTIRVFHRDHSCQRLHVLSFVNFPIKLWTPQTVQSFSLGFQGIWVFFLVPRQCVTTN